MNRKEKKRKKNWMLVDKNKGKDGEQKKWSQEGGRVEEKRRSGEKIKK